MTIERLKQVLLILNDGRFHSGAQLGNSLNITRSAIWKMTKQLEKYHIQLESVVGRGYRLKHPISFLATDNIRSQLSPQADQTIKKIDLFDNIESTSEYLSSRIYETSKLPRICLCEHLKSNKRRQPSNTPHSPIAQDINLSMLWPFTTNTELKGLNVVIGVAIIHVLDQLGIRKQLGLHWPNQLNHQDKALATFDVETRQLTHQNKYAVISLKLHVNNTQTGANDNTSSLQMIKHKSLDRNQIAGKIINQLCYCLSIFQKSGVSLFIDEWNQHDHSANQSVEHLLAHQRS
ncbi:MAG: HTH domain-containing protein [Coxiellaceae bacterium]|nr:HTH domain-containing protein [Coxiellaceae bacterium]